MTQDKKTIAAIILAVMAVPLAIGAETVIASPNKIFSSLSILVMAMNVGAQFMLARSFWTSKTSWASWAGVIFLLSAFFSLGLATPGQYSFGLVVSVALGVFGAFLAIKFPAKEQ